MVLSISILTVLSLSNFRQYNHLYSISCFLTVIGKELCFIIFIYLSPILKQAMFAYIFTIKPVPGTNQYYAMRVKFLAQGNNGSKLGCRLVPKLLNGFRGEDLKFVDYSDILFM